MADTTGVLARLQAALAIYDPTWDVGVGSATYKILESVASEIALANNNSVLQTYSYDVNTKSGNQLDVFCNLFGVYRQLGKRASGMVTFSVDNSGSLATSILSIPVGTQVAIPVGGTYTSAVYFATTAPAIINIGQASQDVPVVATIPGIIGNAPAGTISTLITNLVGITSVTNYNAISGGLDPESDATFRARWQNTAFNNTTGTFAKYVLTALQDSNVTLANAIGTQSFYTEQLQINSNLSVSASGASQGIQFVAYSGQTINNVTYSGVTVVSGFTISGGTTPAAFASGLNNTISGIYPTLVINSGFVFTVSGSTNLGISGNNFTISANIPSPYRVVLSGGTVTSGILSVGNYSFYDYVISNNPDIGASGTQSYNPSFSGYLFPQGSELVGNNVNTYNQQTFVNNTDYIYPTNPTIQLKLTIANATANQSLFVGNSLQVVSEYNPASSRSLAITSGNFVDIFINGNTSSSTIEQVVFNPTFVLSGTSSTSYLNTNYYTLASGAIAATNTATSGDIYVPLNQQPAINFPAQISTASSGQADTLYLYNMQSGSGTTYPICINPYSNVTFTGTAISGSNFVSVTNASTISGLVAGLALTSGSVTSGTTYFISSVSTSGITLNQGASNSGTATLSGRALVYPIYDNTLNQNSILQTTGLVFDSATAPAGWPTLPTGISWIQYQHNYNSDVVTVESLIQQSRPVGVNTLVHQAQYVPLIINAKIVFTNGYSQPDVMSQLSYQIAGYLQSLQYLGNISFANLATQFLGIPGVYNVKITSVQTTAIDGTILNNYTNDFVLASNQLPTLSNILYTIRGVSNF